MNRYVVVAAFMSVTSFVACGERRQVSAPTSSSANGTTATTLTYLGTAGWRLQDGERTLLVDPYFTRTDVEDDAMVLEPNEAVIARYAPPSVDVILIGHSHYDHLLDAPTIAKKTKAKLVGTESTLNVARAAGLPENSFVHVEGGETFTMAPFSVRVARGLHSLTGTPEARIPREIRLPMKARDYAVGDTLQYVVAVRDKTILFVGSANFIEREIEGLRPNVAVVATALREKIPDYSCRLMKALGHPKLVLANHFDAHWEPLGPKQLELDAESRASLSRFADEIHACSPETKVVVPEHFRPLAL